MTGEGCVTRIRFDSTDPSNAKYAEEDLSKLPTKRWSLQYPMFGVRRINCSNENTVNPSDDCRGSSGHRYHAGVLAQLVTVEPEKRSVTERVSKNNFSKTREIMSCDPPVARTYEKKYQWCLATEAFLSWKRLIDAKRKARRVDEKERYKRLSTLSTRAWQRYLRRWLRARSLPE